MLAYVKKLIGDELRMCSMALFTNPGKVPYNLGWHRDVMYRAYKALFFPCLSVPERWCECLYTLVGRIGNITAPFVVGPSLGE